MTRISLMQGRLLPPFENRFQSFPVDIWEDEFIMARDLGLYSIEWIYEKSHEDKNPISHNVGISHLKKIIAETGVQVKSICADYYMTERLIIDGEIAQEHWNHLEWLCTQARVLDIAYIILPFVDSSSLKTEGDQNALFKQLKIFLRENKNQDVEIHLETDLPPKAFLNIFKGVDHPALKLNYDIGNSASLGYDPDREFRLMGDYLGSVHIKDRVLNGKTVPFGTGNADFKKCFDWFHKLHFNRWFVLQGARSENGQEKENIQNQKQFVLERVVM